MAIVLLGADGIFPAGALRARLQSHLPEWRWTCGEEDDGVAGRILPWRASQFIRARTIIGDDAPLFVELRWHHGPWASQRAPMHAARVIIGQPTTDRRQLADQIIALIASTLLDAQNGHGWAQMVAGGNWLDAADAARLAKVVIGGESLVVAAGLGLPPQPDTPPANTPDLASLPLDDLMPAQRSERLGFDTLALAKAEHGFAEALARDEAMAGMRRDLDAAFPAYANDSPSAGRLPTLVALFARAPIIDWARLGGALRLVDPEGNWSIQGEGLAAHARAVDAGLRIVVEEAPVPAWLIEPALDRSYWITAGEGLAALRRHRISVVITPEINCAAAGPDATRAAAKAMTMALAMLVRCGPCAGVYNAATGTLFPAGGLEALLAPLDAGEIPVGLFVWSALHSVTPNAVALSTVGMMPFVGMEVEAWNAPGDLDYVAGKVSGVLRYLLIHGPVIGHGDTFGQREEDRTLRCFLGDSRAARSYSPGAPLPALLLEFADPAPDRLYPPPSPLAPPRPDPLPAPAERRTITPLRTGPAGFGRRAPTSFGKREI